MEQFIYQIRDIRGRKRLERSDPGEIKYWLQKQLGKDYEIWLISLNCEGEKSSRMMHLIHMSDGLVNPDVNNNGRRNYQYENVEKF